METLHPGHVIVMLLALGVLLGIAHVLGECARRLRQPAVVGELLAGVLLGPTVLGALAPEAGAFLFPLQGPNAVALEALTTLAIVLFLLVAGMEVDLSTLWRQGRLGLQVGITSMAVPFAVGLAVAWWLPGAMGRHAGAEPLTFALFFATALSISALPVIVRTLMDLNLYRSDLGMVVVSAAIFNDLMGWIVFAIVLGLLDGTAGHEGEIVTTIVATVAFAGLMLTLGRWLIHRSLPFVQAHTSWPGGVLGFAIVLALLGGALTEWIGIHAIFGSFFVGIAIGDSEHLRERTRVTIEHFVSFIFAPLFFASIGLKVDFLAHLDGRLVATVLVIACLCKLAGGLLGARWGRMARRDAWAVGFALNSRGAMEIILGKLALDAGIIRTRLFVALVLMAIVTSMMSGPLMRLVLKPTRSRRLLELLSPRMFVRSLRGRDREAVIRELAAVACIESGVDGAAALAAVLAREAAQGTGIGNGVAIPHARVEGLPRALLATGLSDLGVDFDAPDGRPARVIFLMLIPAEAASQQLELNAEIAHLFQDPVLLERLLDTRTSADFTALLKAQVSGGGKPVV